MKDLLAGVRAARLLHTLPTLTRQFALVCSCILPSPAAQTVSIMVIRCLHQNALQPHAISELLWVTRSLAVVGYRPGVRSLTCFDVLRAAPQLLPALVRCRQLVWDAAEAAFDAPSQLWVEHTALITWDRGASIGWHHDSNRPYLAQRHVSAVLYLNSTGEDFSGGTFCFQDGPPPLRIEPAAGLLLIYSSDDVHCVEPVLNDGQRCTFTMWLTRDQAHSEDAKVLAQLAAGSCVGAGLPQSMYHAPDSRDDIRLAALARLGVKLVHQQQQSEGAAPPAYMVVPVSSRGCAGAGPACCTFSSMQEAMLAVHMLAWKCCPHSHTVAAAAAGGCHGEGCGSCGCFGDQQLLTRAWAMVQEHLAAAGMQLDKLLPTWHSLGALV